MAMRKRMSRRSSKRSFRKGSKVKKANAPRKVMRGGYRF